MQPLAAERTIPARQNTSQQVNTLRGTINFSDGSTAMQFGTLPGNSIIQSVVVDVVTAFNAATTNVLTLGTTTTATELVAAGDLNEAATGGTSVTRGLGTSLTIGTADIPVYAKYTQSGTAATAGKANILITYVPDNG